MSIITDLNGCKVVEGAGPQKEVRYVLLPPVLWRPIASCRCVYCHNGTEQLRGSYWDTLAVPMGPTQDRTWVVHGPEFHGAPKLRETP